MYLRRLIRASKKPVKMVQPRIIIIRILIIAEHEQKILNPNDALRIIELRNISNSEINGMNECLNVLI